MPALQEEKGEDRWRLLGQTPWVDVYENKRWLPRAWLAQDQRALTEQQQLEVIRAGRLPGGQLWNPLQTALVESQTGLNSSGMVAPGSAEVTRHDPNLVRVRTASTAPAILILSENHYPGWRATLDGREAEVLRVNYNLRGILLPAGEHTVEFVYRPRSVLIGLVISLLASLVLVLWGARPLSKWRARRPTHFTGVK